MTASYALFTDTQNNEFVADIDVIEEERSTIITFTPSVTPPPPHQKPSISTNSPQWWIICDPPPVRSPPWGIFFYPLGSSLSLSSSSSVKIYPSINLHSSRGTYLRCAFLGRSSLFTLLSSLPSHLDIHDTTVRGLLLLLLLSMFVSLLILSGLSSLLPNILITVTSQDSSFVRKMHKGWDTARFIRNISYFFSYFPPHPHHLHLHHRTARDLIYQYW